MDMKVVLATCPFCGCGRCAVRLCNEKELSSGSEPSMNAELSVGKEVSAGEDFATVSGYHAFILCDTCHAAWIEPDLTTCHQYLGAINPLCPLCRAELKEEDSGGDGLKGSWATSDQVNQLGWDHAVSGASRLSIEEIEELFRGDHPIDFSGGTR